MKRNFVFFFFLFSFVLSFCLLFSQIPQTLSYQGVLKDSGGNIAPNGTYNLTFRLYNTGMGGVALWTELQAVQVTDGVFNVILGSSVVITLSFDVPYWLSITVGTGSELTPRIRLTSAAYSLNSNSVVNNAVTTAKISDGAVTLPKINTGGASAGNVITFDGSNTAWQTPASGGIGGSGTVNYFPLFTGTNTQGNSNIQYHSSWGSIGIGTSPEGSDSKLLVQHNLSPGGTAPPYLARFRTRSATLPFIYTDHAYIEGDGDAYFRGRLQVGVSSNPDTSATIYGLSSNAEGKGICGIATAADGTNYGGYFVNNSTTGRGLFGIAIAYSGMNYGIYGLSQSTDGRGVYGVANNSSGTNYGVRGASASSSGYGVYSSGRFAASGTKSFQIDHPLNPENQYLNHYCTEGAEPLNAYSGNALLDDEGQAIVELPPYFESINKDFRYQLTPLDAAMPDLHVAERIKNNRFKIAGGKPDMEVSWRVEAVRNDRWVTQYGAPVEQGKPEGHRGKYLNPELYGQPETMGIFYENIQQ